MDSKTQPIDPPDRLHDYIYLRELQNILIRMAMDMRDIDPEYSKVVDDHFWELI